MRHGDRLRQLSRDSKHRRALLRNQATSLVSHERLVTTTAKAKELKRFADKVITMAKKGNEVGVRSVLFTEPAVQKAMSALRERYATRPGGYTRVLQVGRRYGDQARMAVIELVGRKNEIKEAHKYRKAERERESSPRGPTPVTRLLGLDAAGERERAPQPEPAHAAARSKPSRE